MLMLLNFKIKIRLLGFLSPPNDNKFVTFYKDCPIKVPEKGNCQRWVLIFNSFIILAGVLYKVGGLGLYNPVVGLYPVLGLYNPWSVCGDGGANLVYLSLAC